MFSNHDMVHVYAGEIQRTLVNNTLTISLSFHDVNPTHPSSGGKLCTWTVHEKVCFVCCIN